MSETELKHTVTMMPCSTLLSALWYQEEESEPQALMCLGYYLAVAFPVRDESAPWAGNLTLAIPRVI